MRRFLLLFILLFSHLSYSAPVVMGYWENWSTYKDFPMPGNAQGATNPKLSAQISGLTALSYAFLEVDKEGTLLFSDPWSDLNPNSADDKNYCNRFKQSCGNFPSSAGLGNFGAFGKTTVKYHVISVGGASHDASWENAFHHPQQFVTSLKALIDIYGINWLDIDYEPVNGVPAQNIPALISLVEEIKKALPTLMISYTIPANHHSIEQFGKANWQQLNKSINYIGVMGYDMHGAFDTANPLTALHSALYGEGDDFSSDKAVNALIHMGVGSEKIILGMPMYGRAVGGVQTQGLGKTFSQSVKGDLDDNCDLKLGLATTCSGMIQYKTIIERNYQAIPALINNKLAGVYAYNASEKLFVSYDNAESAKAKAEYVVQNKLGGVLFWALNHDMSVENKDSILGAVDKVFGITPTPAPEVKMKLELTNNDPKNPITISLVTSNPDAYYPFPMLQPQGQKGSSVLYNDKDSSIVASVMNKNQVRVLLTTQANVQVWCEGSLNFTSSTYHHIQVYFDTPKPNCLIQ